MRCGSYCGGYLFGLRKGVNGVDYGTLLGALDAAALQGAIAGLVSNPLVTAAILLVIGARVAPTVFNFIKRAVGRG